MDRNAYDVVIVGGGPAGLSAALALGRARKRVLVCDGGPRRNAAATHIQNFVTRDGTPPDDFRRVAREQLSKYPNVHVEDDVVSAIEQARGEGGARGVFHVRTSKRSADARRVILATGMIDEALPIEGFRELWGTSIFQCPYCHGWEVSDRPWGVLASPTNAGHIAPFAVQARGWTRDVTVFANGVPLAAEVLAQLEAAKIRVVTAPVTRLVARDGHLAAVRVAGDEVPCGALFAHPPQRHVEIVRSLGVALDDAGYVQTDPMTRETSVRGIYAVGDLTTRMQGAILGAAAGTQAAAMLNVELSMELVSNGEL